jgi:uncharacterized membrane protein YbhN (UPF0104 family)
MLKKLRPFISLFLLAAALGVAFYYLGNHKSLVTKLEHTPLKIGLEVLILYFVLFLALMFKLAASLKICRTNLGQIENAKLNAHTLLINFFIPGQGGPVYLGVYLFKKHKLRPKNYLLATAVYYVIYAVLSVCMLLGAVRPWWQTLIAIILIGCAGVFVSRRYVKKSNIKTSLLSFSPGAIGMVVMATAFQVIIQAVIYGIELKSVNHHIDAKQIITYTGAANLALFASLTPGGIGIRESFLLFTRHLNHISSANIVVASVIDRSVYLVFLLVLIVITAGVHLHDNLINKNSDLKLEKQDKS